ncbi:zinc ABC transporter substrate-binding protein [Aurantimonas sp. MSK8Z-1]|uniref:zinc ABC transporter substrate-binding protein n=1 Tax=Mangrovibrevibacter kandeliae TaxID=2968473 RepID=UPI002117AF66|nr:zinc ABC transporter substrate-binding protein [Aurantimonas sp. MSK8Z-1]MCW4116784.1 zinc ABC transporter substrate-binding protein [Aurantimonas sp. MSK8Z-1]
MSNFLRSAACAAALVVASSAHAAPDVVASIKPLHSLVAAVMQGIAEPGLIVTGSASPHEYSLRPSDAATLQKADLVFWIGPDFEHFLVKPLETLAPTAGAVALERAPGIHLLAPRKGGTFEPDADGDHDDEGPVDGHLFLDPENAKAMVDAIETRLAAADPENAARYHANAAALRIRLDQLIAGVAAELAPVADRSFIVFHDAYHYFEERFGVRAAGSITVEPDVTPGAQRLAAIRAKVQELGATCVFAEPQFHSRLIDTVVDGTAARTGILDPEGTALEPGADLYATLIQGLADNLRDCLASEG